MRKLLVLILAVSLCFSVTACKSEEVDLESYDLSVKLCDDMTLECNLTYEFTCKASELNAMYFSLYPNAFSENSEISPVYESDVLLAYPNGKSYGKVEIFTAKMDGNDCEYFIDGKNGETLKVGFNHTVKKGERKEIFMKFKVTLPNVKHRTGYAENTVNLTGFYPIACVLENGEFYQSVYYPAGDPFYSNCANYKVNLTVPSTYSVASSMVAERTEWSGGNTEYFYTQKNVREVAFILSEKFNILEKTVDGVSVKYYYYADESPEKTLETACDSLTFFSKKYYKYPYKTYTVSQGDFIYGGMEYPCLSLISDSVEPSYRDYVVAHETAHQWFYGILGVNESEYAFLDEGLTELSTALFLDGRNGGKSYADYVTEAENSYKVIKDALAYIGNLQLPIMERNLKEFNSQAEYVMIAYNRSEIMFDRIKKNMGDKKFFAFIQELIKNYAYKNVSVKEFRTQLKKKSPSAVEIFDNFVSGEAQID